MNPAQQKYTTGEQELLSIVETLKTFENILLGQDVVVHTDHLNLVKDKVLLTKPGVVPKLTDPRTGPFEITKVHDNGTVEIQKGPSVTQTVNIRRLTPPYFESTEPLGSG